jgi:hypothetical protein
MSAPLGAKLGLSAAAALATLAALELALRVAGVGEVMTYRPDPRFGYSMAPNQSISTYGPIVAINALGLRGPPVEEKKPAGRARVLVLGDSVAYGGGRVREEELFCRVLESRARARGRDVEVVNVSAPAGGAELAGGSASAARRGRRRGRAGDRPGGRSRARRCTA